MTDMKEKIIDLLDEHKVFYQLIEYTKPACTIEAGAAQRGGVQQDMIKSILLREKSNGRYVMACVPGDLRLNPQAVRAHLPIGWKRLSFASAEEIHAGTGYVRGAVAPLCLPKGLPVFFDEAIVLFTKVNISSGDPMIGLELDAQDLIMLAGASTAPIAWDGIGEAGMRGSV